MSKALELIRTLIDGANEYEKKTGNTNPTVYLSRNNLMVIEQALLKAQEPKKYVDELKLVEKKLKALEIIKGNFIIKFDKEIDIEGNVWGLLVSIQAKENEGEWDCTACANLAGYEEEFNLLKEVLE